MHINPEEDMSGKFPCDECTPTTGVACVPHHWMCSISSVCCLYASPTILQVYAEDNTGVTVTQQEQEEYNIWFAETVRYLGYVVRTTLLCDCYKESHTVKHGRYAWLQCSAMMAVEIDDDPFCFYDTVVADGNPSEDKFQLRSQSTRSEPSDGMDDY